MAKSTVENAYSISTTLLKQHGNLEHSQWKSGTMRWSFNDEECGSVGFSVSTIDNFIDFNYRTKVFGEEEWKPESYRISLITTSCYFGGKRYWFRCKVCCKRVGVIFIGGNSQFACRECLNLTYESRNKCKRFAFLGHLFKYDEIAEQIDNLRVKYYRGKPTKRYKKLVARKISHGSSFAKTK